MKDSHTFVPPRSKEFYRIGPEFNRTIQNFQLFDPNGNPLYTIISARIDRGFQKTDGDNWLSYRRNYFTLVASYSLVGKDDVGELGKTPQHPVMVSHGGVTSKVKSFAIRITAFRIQKNGECDEIALIQHTAKRDKGPRQPPAIVPAVPGVLPDHAFMRDNANYRSTAQLRKVEPFFFKSKSLIGPFTEGYPEEKVAHVVLFDRVQFTTAGGGGSQTCKAAVQLIVTLEDDTSNYVVAHSETPTFTLRNRSPGNYYEDGTLIPRSRKAAMNENDNSNANEPRTNDFDDNKKEHTNKRQNSFVTERPDLKVARLSSNMYNSLESQASFMTVDGAGQMRNGFGEIKFEHAVLPTLDLKNELPVTPSTPLKPTAPLPNITPATAIGDVPKDLNKKRRGRPPKTPSGASIEPEFHHDEDAEQSGDDDDSEQVKNKPDNGDEVEEESDSEEEETAEEIRKRDLMRLRSGRSTVQSETQAERTGIANPESNGFELQIGRARPSASRETHGPAETGRTLRHTTRNST